MSQNKPTKQSKIATVSSKSLYPKKVYHCYYCKKELKNSNEICSYCEQLNDQSDENSQYYRLSSARIPLRNLVYVIGLAPEIAKPEILGNYEYFGQYGKIKKLVVSKTKAQKQCTTFSAYVTYTHESEAALAIYAIDETPLYHKTIRAFFGTTKYCTYFLKELKCLNEDCVYLHEFVKDDILLNEEQEEKKVTLAYLLSFYDEFKKYKPKIGTMVFPNVSSILQNIDKAYENSLISEKKAKKTEKNMNKPLDIISLDVVNIEEKLKTSEQKTREIQIIEEDDVKIKKKNSKTKTRSKDYHSDENSKVSCEETEENFSKIRRKTVNVTDVDQLIIKSFISDKFGKNKNSRFGFAKTENENDEKANKIIENQRIKIARSIQNFFLKWSNKHNPIEDYSLIFNFTSKELKDE